MISITFLQVTYEKFKWEGSFRLHNDNGLFKEYFWLINIRKKTKSLLFDLGSSMLALAYFSRPLKNKNVCRSDDRLEMSD